jgi:hypothetical protein
VTEWAPTETCEHIFGILRQLKKDFNYADMLHLERKLGALILGDFQLLTPEQQEQQTAGGYHHTYFRAGDLDMAALMTWPTDNEIFAASNFAFDEAEQLLRVTGIDARAALATYIAPTPRLTRGLPSSRPLRPQTLHDLLQLYVAVPLPPSAEDQAELYEMALASHDVDKTLTMWVFSAYARFLVT